jgi:hypothetical protein
VRVPAAVGANPTPFGRVAWSGTGRVLREARPSQPRIRPGLPARAPETLNRLLRTAPWSPRALRAGRVVLVRGRRPALGPRG